jgi:hypothetical protein
MGQGAAFTDCAKVGRAQRYQDHHAHFHVSDDDVFAAMTKEQGGHSIGHSDEKGDRRPPQNHP